MLNSYKERITVVKIGSTVLDFIYKDNLLLLIIPSEVLVALL